MSGPKVVRIVTREEIIAICKGHLAGLNQAIQEWIKFCQANGVATEEEIAATLARPSALAKLLAEDRFEELQKAVPAEIDFLKADRQTRFERVAEKKAKALASQRRTEAAAAAILGALDRSGKSVSNDLRSSLEQIAAGHSTDTSAITQAFALLSEDKPAGVSELQRELASAHKENETRQTFNQWLASQSHTESEEEFQRLDLLLAKLSVVLEDKAVSDFQERLRSLSSQEPSRNRSLRIDSLELDLGQAVSNARKRNEIEQRLKILAAQLSEIQGEEAHQWSQAILVRLNEPLDALVELETKAQEVLAEALKEIAAGSRRQAVLNGLAELGYQVSEGMETGWVQNGRIVLKRALDTGYGVEIVGNVDSGRVQMRTVAFRKPDSNGDKSSDRAAEIAFCSDVSKLQHEFAEEGSQIVIERALEIGATPLKTVPLADAGQEEFRERIPPAVQQRSIK
jgi:hypothetical protein